MRTTTGLSVCLLTALAGVALVRADAPAGTEPPASTPASISPTNLLALCVASLPREPIELTGSIAVRRQRGIVVSEHPYVLKIDWGATPQRVECSLTDKDPARQQRVTVLRRDSRTELELRSGADLELQPAPALTTRMLDTDMTWLDLTLDFLWWPTARFDGQENVLDRPCDVVLVSPPVPLPGCSAVRLCIESRIHCLMRVEQLDDRGRVTRRMSVRSLKKFRDRWLIREMDVEATGSELRTRFRVDDVLTP